MKLGMVSGTFGHLKAEDVIDIAVKNGMDAVEWSAESHVPVGNFEKAEHICRLCEKAGLFISAYGSCYCVGNNSNPEKAFALVLETAKKLGTKNIKVLAGNISSEKADDTVLKSFLDEARLIADISQTNGLKLSFEYKPNTLLDNYISANGLLDRLARDNIYLNWQPNQTTSMIYNIYELKMLLRHINDVYVFYQSAFGKYLPLIEGKDGWQQYLKILKENSNRTLLLEFMPEDNFDLLKEDFALLKQLAASA